MYKHYDKSKRHRSQPCIEMVSVVTVVDGKEVITYAPSKTPNLPDAEHYKTENLIKAGLNPDEVIKVQTSVGTNFEATAIVSLFDAESMAVLESLKTDPTPAPASVESSTPSTE